MEERLKGRSMKQSFDWKLVIIYLLLVLIGWVNIYASIHSAGPTSIFDWDFRCGKQFIWIITAFFLALTILFAIPPKLWENSAALLYIGVLFLLVAVIFLGIEVKGSRSWFEFGPVRFQPAEVSKITTSLLLAYVMSAQTYKLSNPKNFLVTAAIIILPMLIILAESETGSALVYVGFIFVLYREGLSGWFIFFVGLVILIFIMTLTASPYASLLALIGVLTFCNALDDGRIGRWFLTWGLGLVALIILSHLPDWLAGSKELVEAGAEAASEAVAAAGTDAASTALTPDGPSALSIGMKKFGAALGDFFEKVKPFYIVLGASALALPLIMVKAYKKKNNFLGISALAYIIGVVLIFSTDIIFNNILQDHQRKRIEVLLGMKEDPSGVGYNVNQSMIAIGSGGFFGKGFLHGTQTTYGFVPEQSTDFIFCTVGEEWGFVGCTIVILLYVALIWRIIHDAEESREHFTRIYGYCVAACFFMHLFINIGMTIGLMPVIGIPLPFMSYGGSSLWAFTILLFIFIALHHEEKKYF